MDWIDSVVEFEITVAKLRSFRESMFKTGLQGENYPRGTKILTCEEKNNWNFLRWQENPVARSTATTIMYLKVTRYSWRNFCGNMKTINETSRLRRILATTSLIPSVLLRMDGTSTNSERETLELLLDTHSYTQATVSKGGAQNTTLQSCHQTQ